MTAIASGVVLAAVIAASLVVDSKIGAVNSNSVMVSFSLVPSVYA